MAADTVTANTRCQAVFTGNDGTTVGMGNVATTMLLVVARTGQVFPELIPYDVVLNSRSGTLNLKMRSAAGHGLGTPLSNANDPAGRMPSFLTDGFRLTVSAPGTGTVMDATIPPLGWLDNSVFGMCLSMVGRSVARPQSPQIRSR